MESIKKPLSSPNRRPSWFDLPQKLKKGKTALQNLSGIGAVIKSWSTDTSSSTPQLVEIELNPTPTTPCREIPFIPGDDGFCYYYERMGLYHESGGQGIFFKGYSHKQLIVLDANLSHCYAKSAVSGGLDFLPAWDHTVPFKLATLSSEEDIMVITGVSIPAFGFFNMEKMREKPPTWKMKNCSAIDLFNPSNDQNKPMVFTNAIGSEGKFYAISLQGTLAVIEDWEIKDLGKNRAVPCSKEARVFREHLLEYEKQIFLVFLVSRGSIDVVDDVEVLRLDVMADGYSWEKVESLPADAMFFVGEKCCMGISAGVVGSRGNCIYFTHHRAAGWFVYDMGGKSISPTRGPEVDRTEAHTDGLFTSVMDYL